MSKRRPSIKGRGAEILFGEPPPSVPSPYAWDDFSAGPGGERPAEAQDLSSEDELLLPESEAMAEDVAQGEGAIAAPDADAALLAPQPAANTPPEPAPTPETLPDEETIASGALGVREMPAAAIDADEALLPVPENAGIGRGVEDTEVDLALGEEALDGEPLVPDDDEPWTGTPDVEAALLSEAGAAEDPDAAVAPLPSPTLEASMDEIDVSRNAAMHEPPPPEMEDVTHGVEPPRGVSTVFIMPEGQAGAVDVQAGAGVKPEEVNPELTPEQAKAVLEQISEKKLKQLDREIDATYREVIEVVGDNEDITNECYNLLLKARDTMWRRDAGRIAQAEYYLQQVHARLRRARASGRDAATYQYRILGWGGFWGLLLITLLVLQGQAWFRDAVMPAPANDALIDMRIFVPAMLWGGIGGVTAVLYSLFKHVGERDFDKGYNLSYVGKPFLGAILGVAVYMAFTLLMRTLYILPAGLSGSEATAPAIAPQIIYLFAWAGGFKENRVLDLMDRVMKQLFSGGEEPAPMPVEGES